MVARRRAYRLLSDVHVRQAKGPAQFHDGGGLYFEVDERNNGRWVLRLTINGNRTRRGLGSYPEISLSDAREEADRLRRGAASGKDVRAEERAAQAKTDAANITFEDYFREHFNTTIRAALNPKFATSYLRSVEQHLFPAIGQRPIAEIRTKELVEALRPIWTKIPERARRVLQRAAVAFESAITNEIRLIADPTRGVKRELGRSRPRVKHRPSLPWQEAPSFLPWLRSRPRVSPSCRLALEMILFTGLRSEEVRLAKWREFDIETREWRVPGVDQAETERLGYEGYQKKRMKTGLVHVVPLSTGAIQVLREALTLKRDMTADAFVFPSARNGPLSDNSLSKLLRSGGFAGKASPHGFRATLKTWCAEHAVRDEVSEAILAHGDPDLVRKAYRHATYFEERRQVLQQWCDYLTKRSP
ncbi:MAG: tyrosine-type recombinase/integrase [Proteobacteria bacterium]|nr:tyrosine-type recombinase/integrase [Pseudomonadota bacterium]